MLLSVAMVATGCQNSAPQKGVVHHPEPTNAIYHWKGSFEPTAEELAMLKARMSDIVMRDLAITRQKCLSEQVAQEYERYGFDDRLDLLPPSLPHGKLYGRHAWLLLWSVSPLVAICSPFRYCALLQRLLRCATRAKLSGACYYGYSAR